MSGPLYGPAMAQSLIQARHALHDSFLDRCYRFHVLSIRVTPLGLELVCALQ